MQMPLNIGEVMKTSESADAARKMHVSVALFIDEDCGDELAAYVTSLFSTELPAAHVSVQGYPSRMPELDFDLDLAVLVAGCSKNTGAIAERIREEGVPVMIVTAMPALVNEIAQVQGYTLLEEDLLSPDIMVDGEGLPEDDDFNIEPYPLTAARLKSLNYRMSDWIVATYREKRSAFALAFEFVRRPLSLDFVFTTAIQNAAVGLVALIPGADMPVMTLNQAKMMLQIAGAYGHELGKDRLFELIGVVAGGFACRGIARQLVGLIPGTGWLVKSGIGFTGTVAMGYASIAYFESLMDGGLSPEEALEAAKAEMAKVKEAMEGKENRIHAILAGAKVIVGDVVEVSSARVKTFLPAMRSVLEDARDTAHLVPSELNRVVASSLSELRKTERK